MSGFPPDLAPLKCFVVRALEMEPHDKQISYYCSLYALQQAMRVMEAKPSPEVKKWVHNAFGELEVLKEKIGALKGKDYFENFVLRVFAGADTEDRRQGSTKETAKKFLVCGQFIEVMNVFDQLPPDWEEKRIYCKWKASDINTAIKEGRTPLPGGPGEQAATEGEEESKESFGQPQFTAGVQPLELGMPPAEVIQPAEIHKAPEDLSPPLHPQPQPKPNVSAPGPPPPVVRPKPQPQSHHAPSSQPTSGFKPSQAPSTRGAMSVEDRAAIQTSLKFCKNATSELEFKKVTEAKNWLRQALNTLSQQFPD
mmetsp:Transcript_18950/g.34296  ORF Transcript_18950/g.34296 Transcript_18950/m.34296 type:complete len:310 (+) Transcript_18950:437-1366(+)|eukprot:CAMPEP_0204905844 /NCGR_PEP_ID=MMETSP1397-20131031/5652_1 /ASSEMBLY_ACC=CAM_ASM_000891 /TAXON_ID=49980 /ORGANISM="Climacostomum Climacostomum virens, Strain Stock W-24" /LENGTH=309 /DNA_ID=CAMNT_0052074781 /DNA_START=430 /DNA_END=1359 /DNA_ORIENTATION=-